jgi:CubicO group peptidase (beta-lactamase class C family)
MILRRFSIFVIFALLFSGASAQDFKSIDSIINAEIAQNNIAGGVALVYFKGKPVLDKAYGFADKAALQPMQINSIFRIASMTKAIVSIAVLQLVDKGLVQLDDPIEKYIPTFKNQKVAILKQNGFDFVEKNRSITIRDLLSHQSGISSADEYPKYKNLFIQYGLDQGLNLGFKNLEEEVNQIAAMPLVHQPGARFSYGLSTNVLGRLIEIIAHQNLDQFLQINVLKPLDMKDTYFYLPESKKSRLVKTYSKTTANILEEVDTVLFPINYPLRKERTYFSAIGGLVSTTHDYVKFLNCLLNNGLSTNGKQLISKKILIQFWSNQLGDKTFVFGGFPSLNNFGLGVGLTTEKGQSINNASIGSFFWGGAFNTAYMVDKNRDLITLFYFQRIPFVLPPLLSKLEKTTIQIIDQYNHAGYK